MTTQYCNGQHQQSRKCMTSVMTTMKSQDRRTEKWKENISSVKEMIKVHKNTGNDQFSEEKER